LKDYYRILGILDDAEDIIIRAAYKALAQRYHPDKWKGNSDEAHRKMADLNEAYAVLSDIQKRREYDEEYFTKHPRNEAEEESRENDYEDIKNEELEGWAIAESFFPNIKDYYEELRKFSPIVANTFRSNLLATQNFKNSLEIKSKLESEYFERYYGFDKKVQPYAKILLLNKHYKAALHVNQVVFTLGTSVSYEEIKLKIEDKFPEVVGLIPPINVGVEREKLIASLKGTYWAPRELCDLYKRLFGDAIEVKSGFFDSKYIASIDGIKTNFSLEEIKQRILTKI
jgi:curved DNA-binding protein CbpA